MTNRLIGRKEKIKILNRFKKRERLYTVLVTESQLRRLFEGEPNGGDYGQYCFNSELFKDRVCKLDSKKYRGSEVCACFRRIK